MRTFPESPRLEVLQPEWYELVEPYRYEWTHEEIPNRLTVRPDFQCDLASIPKFIRWWIGHQDLGLGPPLVHDGFYACAGQLSGYRWLVHERLIEGDWEETTGDWIRWDVERLFGRFMRETDRLVETTTISPFKRRVACRATFWFGWSAWSTTRLGNQQP